MKQAKPLTSYSQFRKKNTNIKSPCKEIVLSEIDHLTQQLENINSIKQIQIKKYAHPNGIIEEQEEEEFSYRNSEKKNIIPNCNGKKVKLTNNKQQQKNTNNNDNKNTPNIIQSMNKKVKNRQPILKTQIKNPKKEDQSTRVLQHQKTISSNSRNNSLISTNQSVNTTITSTSDKSISQSQKKVIIEKIKNIKSKIHQKNINFDIYQKLLKYIENVDKMLENF